MNRPSLPGRISCLARSCACCWRRTTSRSFSARSHGFRPGLGCHTALTEVARTWTGTTWFIEGDIADCFGSLDHSVLLGILGEKILDNRAFEVNRDTATIW